MTTIIEVYRMVWNQNKITSLPEQHNSNGILQIRLKYVISPCSFIIFWHWSLHFFFVWFRS